INQDYDYLEKAATDIPRILRYGTKKGDYTGEIENDTPYLQVKMTKGSDLHIQTKLVGDYNLPNVLSAVAIGLFFGVPEHLVKEALENYTPGNSRSQLIEKN